MPFNVLNSDIENAVNESLVCTNKGIICVKIESLVCTNKGIICVKIKALIFH